MKKLALLALLLSSTCVSAQTQPAQMGITPTTLPEVLQVLDNTKTWVSLGTVNSTTHTFTPVGGGGGSGGDGVGVINVTNPSVGMANGGPDNSPLLSTLMNTIGPSSFNWGSAEVVFPGTPGQALTPYYFSQQFTVSRVARYRCGNGTANSGVELVFAAGVQGVVVEDAHYTPDGQYGGGTVDGCMIISLGYGSGQVVANATTVTQVSMQGDNANIIPPSVWHVGDGIIVTPTHGGSNPANATPLFAPGAYVTGVAGTTLTLAPGYVGAPGLTDGYASIEQLPASLKFTVQTTIGGNSVVVTAGPRPLVSGEMIWSDAFPLGTTVFNTSGNSFPQTINMTNPFNTGGAQNATVTHTSGAPGQMWVVPAALKRDVSSSSHGNSFFRWPIGLQMACSSAGYLNCDGSYDESNVYFQDFFGRWTAGNNTSASSSKDEQGHRNNITDFFNGAPLGEVDINFNAESGEDGTAYWGIMGNCGNQNYSVMFGGYLSVPAGGGGCANGSSILPPSSGSPWLMIGLQTADATGSSIISAQQLGGPWVAQKGSNCVGLNYTAGYILSVSRSGCATGGSMGVSWDGNLNAWTWSYQGSNFIFNQFGDDYLGYLPPDKSGGLLPAVLELGNSGDDWTGEERALDSGTAPPTSVGRLRGDVRFNQTPSPSTSMAWSNVKIGQVTLAANLAAGATSVAVSACPTSPAMPAGVWAIAFLNINTPPIVLDQPLGTLASCTGTTLTLNAGSTFASANGTTIQFLEWHPAGVIANDPAGTRWTLGNYMSLNPVALASLTAGCTPGTFAVINNGVASPVYNAAVGSTTGAATDPVFCNGGSVWTYH